MVMSLCQIIFTFSSRHQQQKAYSDVYSIRYEKVRSKLLMNYKEYWKLNMPLKHNRFSMYLQNMLTENLAMLYGKNKPEEFQFGRKTFLIPN